MEIPAPLMEFGADKAFAVDLRNDAAIAKNLAENNLEEGKFLVSFHDTGIHQIGLFPARIEFLI